MFLFSARDCGCQQLLRVPAWTSVQCWNSVTRNPEPKNLSLLKLLLPGCFLTATEGKAGLFSLSQPSNTMTLQCNTLVAADEPALTLLFHKYREATSVCPAIVSLRLLWGQTKVSWCVSVIGPPCWVAFCAYAHVSTIKSPLYRSVTSL